MAGELGNPPRHDVGARFRAINDWAGTNGYFAGYPNFHEADYGQGTVYGTILLKSGMAKWPTAFAINLADAAFSTCALTSPFPLTYPSPRLSKAPFRLLYFLLLFENACFWLCHRSKFHRLPICTHLYLNCPHLAVSPTWGMTTLTLV